MRRDDGTYRKVRKSGHGQGQAHELTFSCYRGLPLLSKDRSRRWLIESLERARRRQQFELWAYVIMPEHVHVLLMPRSATVEMAAILKAIKQPVARAAIRFLRENAPQWLERLRVELPGGRILYHFWQPGGGYDRNIENARVAWAVVEYIHANPVRRGLVDAPTDWPWSSAAWYGGVPDVTLAMDAGPPEI